MTPVYEVAPHPDFNFKAGDTVLRLAAPGDIDPSPGAGLISEGTRVAAEHQAAVEAGRAAAAPAAADEPKPAGGGRSGFHETMQTFLGGLAAPARAELAGEGGAKDSDDDGDGEEGAEGGGGDNRLGLSAWVGEILTVGPMLTVRWMDGTLGTAPPEELYVVNTDEEARPPGPLHAQPFARTAPCTCSP